MNIANVDFLSNQNLDGSGGAMLVSNCTMLLEDSTFHNNTAISGGAVLAKVSHMLLSS